jgi:hypothetical protein
LENQTLEFAGIDQIPAQVVQPDALVYSQKLAYRIGFHYLSPIYSAELQFYF